KTQAPTELLAAVKKAHAGGTYVSPALAERLAVELRSGFAGRAHEALSAREYQVLCLLGTGRTNKEIAVTLADGPKTASTYCSRVLRKLHLKTNADLVRYVIEQGLAPYPPGCQSFRTPGAGVRRLRRARPPPRVARSVWPVRPLD